MSKEKLKFFTLKNILAKGAKYNVIFGERSNGKTYAVLKYAYEKFLETGEQLAIIRRWDEDFVGANSAKTCYDSLMCNGNGVNVIEKLSKGEYTGVEYYAGKYYLTIKDEETQKSKRTDKIVAIAFSLTGSEHYKSASFPKIKTILLDEFMTRKYYLPNEFIDFQNVLSTIIRTRDDVTIFMCANTVNKYGCPYFTEMGLYRIKQMKQGDIDVYTYGESGLTVAVEWSDGIAKQKPSDIYFAFDNPRLQMIKTGAWEMDIYPHCPVKYVPKDILFTYFILYDEQLLQCEVVQHSDNLFTFIHRKTTELKDTINDLIFTPDYNPRPNYRRRITEPHNNVTKKILWFFNNEKVFYQDNEIGEIVRNYMNFCKGGE